MEIQIISDTIFSLIIANLLIRALRRVFVYENDEYVNSKLKEYGNSIQDDLLAINKVSLKNQNSIFEEQEVMEYRNKITEFKNNGKK